MCVLVYPKNEAQKSALTSFWEEKDIDFDYEEPRATPNEYLKLLENRIDEIKCNPESAGSSFNDFDKKMRAKYGFWINDSSSSWNRFRRNTYFLQ